MFAAAVVTADGADVYGGRISRTRRGSFARSSSSVNDDNGHDSVPPVVGERWRTRRTPSSPRPRKSRCVCRQTRASSFRRSMSPFMGNLDGLPRLVGDAGDEGVAAVLSGVVERERHPLALEGPLVVEVLQESLAVTTVVLALAQSTAKLRGLADDPRTPEGLRAACRNAVDVLSEMGWPRVLEASREIGSAAGEWFEGIGERFDHGAFPTLGGKREPTE